MCDNKGKYRTQQQNFQHGTFEVDVSPNGDFSFWMCIDFLPVRDYSTYH
jgi:hypothetical protein